MVTWPGTPLVPGTADGTMLVLDEPISFWGGVDPDTGRVADHRHPQSGSIVTGAVVVMATGRGSSSSSTVLAEMIRTGAGPAAIVLGQPDAVIVLGAVVASELYDLVMPILTLPTVVLGSLRSGVPAAVGHDGTLVVGS